MALCEGGQKTCLQSSSTSNQHNTTNSSRGNVSTAVDYSSSHHPCFCIRKSISGTTSSRYRLLLVDLCSCHSTTPIQHPTSCCSINRSSSLLPSSPPRHMDSYQHITVKVTSPLPCLLSLPPMSIPTLYTKTTQFVLLSDSSVPTPQSLFAFLISQLHLNVREM